MVFCSALFLFLFLPAVLAIYYLLPRPGRNLLLLVASLIFYAWGSVSALWIMLASIGLNYLAGLAVERSAQDRFRQSWILTLTVIANLGMLGWFKYACFIEELLQPLISALGLTCPRLPPIELPIGISFFTFQALSYVVDVARREVPAQRNLFDLALYISFFPQLVAGPIVRYFDVAAAIRSRQESLSDFAEGVRRFIMGLAKKMLLANTMGAVTDLLFHTPDAELTLPLAWLVVVCYALQIYYDFSGYSDMAIGLGLMFGFRFLENFNAPYHARSITDFWRRWHLSLSTWFRDYLYIPLGGNRRGPIRTGLNLLTVFLLCGLWHGANWTFILWGLFHGFFLVLERAGLQKFLTRLPAAIGHLYTLLVVLCGWTLFRAQDLTQAAGFYRAMFGMQHTTADSHLWDTIVDAPLLWILLAAILCTGSLPQWRELFGLPTHRTPTADPALGHAGPLAQPWQLASALGSLAALLVLFGVSVMLLAASSYNPFIYFRF